MSKTSRPSRRIGRDASHIASRFPAAPAVSVSRRSQNLFLGATQRPVILPVDRRAFNPSPANVRPALRFSGRPARVVAPPPVKRLQSRSGHVYTPPQTRAQLLFQQASGVAVCVQRGIRKEVLHAKGVAGSSGLRAPKRGPYSSVKCNNYG